MAQTDDLLNDGQLADNELGSTKGKRSREGMSQLVMHRPNDFENLVGENEGAPEKNTI